MTGSWIGPAVAALTGLVLFALLWTGITTLLARLSGWGGLASKFAGVERPMGEVLNGQVVGFGLVRENNVTRAILATGGLYLFPNALFGLGRPPLLIPYAQIRYSETSRLLWARSHTLLIDGSAKIQVRDRLLQELRSHGVTVPADALA